MENTNMKGFSVSLIIREIQTEILILIKMAKTKTSSNVGKYVKQLGLSHIGGCNAKWSTHFGKPV